MEVCVGIYLLQHPNGGAGIGIHKTEGGVYLASTDWVGGINQSQYTKYFAVALRDAPMHDNYDGPKHKAHRIEFRCIGNTDYHLRFDDLGRPSTT